MGKRGTRIFRQSYIVVSIVLVISLVLIYTVGCSQSSPAADTPVLPMPPSTPLNLRAESISQTNVTLRWTDNSDNEQGFKIYRDGVLIKTVDMNVTTHIDKDLRPAISYRYIVRAYNQVGESENSLLTVRTLNPPITVKLDRIGVFDNGESAFRDVNGGEVYVYTIISDGKTNVESRIPLQEDSYLVLEDDEVVEIGSTIFSTDEVGDSLTIAFVGYESDGGDFEQLVYDALGVTLESQMAGGAGGLLEAFSFNLGGLIGQFFGEEDDWLGSYENKWSSTDNWGLGRYSDIPCEEIDGTPGLRLWFTVESSMESLLLTEPNNSIHVLAEDSLRIDPFDESAFLSKYSGTYPSQYPFNEYGVYYSDLVTLNENETVSILLRSSNQACVEDAPDDCEDGLVMMIFRRMDQMAIRTNAAQIISCEIDNSGGTWVATVIFNAIETGYYQLGLLNKSGQAVTCEYMIFLED